MPRSDDEAIPRRRRELADVTRAELGGWTSPHHGYHRRTSVNDPARQRIIDAAAVLPDGAVVGGWAAAFLLGATALDGRDQAVLVVIPPERIVSRRGITTVRTRLDPADIVQHHGPPAPTAYGPHSTSSASRQPSPRPWSPATASFARVSSPVRAFSRTP